jgi:hypothetical protein
MTLLYWPYVTDPKGPPDPTDHTDPTDPTNPTEATEPTDPTDSIEPTDPTDLTDLTILTNLKAYMTLYWPYTLTLYKDALSMIDSHNQWLWYPGCRFSYTQYTLALQDYMHSVSFICSLCTTSEKYSLHSPPCVHFYDALIGNITILMLAHSPLQEH